MTLVKERGIIFTAWSIPKVLDGTKPMTRRTYGLEEVNKHPEAWCDPINIIANIWRFASVYDAGEFLTVKCPYGQVGDRLWLKETFFCNDYRYPNAPIEEMKAALYYKVDGEGELGSVFEDGNPRWQSPLFMFRWASRIDLEITDLRAERLQDISETNIISEGCCEFPHTFNVDELELARRDWFAGTWNSLNAKRDYGWEANPRVWVIGFRRLK